MAQKAVKEHVGDNAFAGVSVSTEFKKLSPVLRNKESTEQAVLEVSDFAATMKQIESLEDIDDGDEGFESLLGLSPETPRGGPDADPAS